MYIIIIYENSEKFILIIFFFALLLAVFRRDTLKNKMINCRKICRHSWCNRKHRLEKSTWSRPIPDSYTYIIYASIKCPRCIQHKAGNHDQTCQREALKYLKFSQHNAFKTKNPLTLNNSFNPHQKPKNPQKKIKKTHSSVVNKHKLKRANPNRIKRFRRHDDNII